MSIFITIMMILGLFWNESLNQCFQSVSDGKSKVASAISDKGVNTESDATFQVMHDNILILAMQQYKTGYADGLASISNASITYEKHYHTGSPTTGGGCYTTPVYKSEPVYGTCPNVVGFYTSNHDHMSDQFDYECMVCHARWWGDGNAQNKSHISKIPTSYAKTLIGYSVGCGYTDGQIISATIKY